MGLNRRFNFGHLVHHLFVDVHPAGRVDDYGIQGQAFGHGDRFPGHANRILLLDRIYRDVNLVRERLELVNGGGTIDVGSRQHGISIVLLLQIPCQFGAERGFARTLQSGDQDYRGRGMGYADIHPFLPQNFSQFVVYDLGELLARIDGGQHLLSHGPLLHFFGERFGHLVVDVGVQQGAADFPHGLRDVYIADLRFALQRLNGAVQF